MADWNEGFDRQYQQLQQQIADGGNVAQIQQQMQQVVAARDEAARAEAYRNDQWHRDHGTGPYAPAGGVTGGGGAAVAPPPAFSAKQIMDSFFASLGISGISDWAADLYNRGAGVDEIVRALRYGTDTSDAGKAARDAYLRAFPGMDEFLKSGRFPGENPEVQYMQYRNTVREAASRYGVDERLVTNDAVANYIRGNTSAVELSDRMSMAATAIATTPAETYAYLSDYYGLQNNDLLSLYLDTDQTEAELQKRYTSARIGLEAGRQRFQIGREYAEDLAQRGVSIDEATRGFGQASQQSGFTTGRGDTVTENTLFESAFGNGLDAAAVARVADARRNRFAGGGDYTGTERGLTGLGSASS